MPIRAFQIAVTVLCSLAPVLAAGQSTTAVRLDGQRVPLLPPHARAAVLFFVATDCPISNRYQPEILRLEHEFTPQGVAFWFVYPNLSETPSGIRAHRADFAPVEGAAHVLLDPDLSLVHLTGARITPQAAILLPAPTATLRSVYTGRIDDRYLGIGNERPQTTRHDLEDAINASLAGHPISPPGGPSVGCSIITVR